MSKKLLALFLVLGLMAYAEDTDTVVNDTTATESSAEENVATTELTKQVTSENNQQLDVKEIDTEDLIRTLMLINSRPRKCLSYATPFEKFLHEISF